MLSFFWNLTFSDSLYKTFVKYNRYMYFINGLGNTLILSVLAIVIGILIGVTVCLLKLLNFEIKLEIRRYVITDNRLVSKLINGIANAYIDVIRGTPAITQLLIIYFVVFQGSMLNKLIIASIAFGINSGAYVAEIMRAGILSIDVGQVEAGRSLGMNYIKTMRYIILPQAIKNILPALVNEFIVLIKETSIAGYIGIEDLTKGATSIQSQTYDAVLPLITSAVIYYIIVKVLTIALSFLEKWLRKSDGR